MILRNINLRNEYIKQKKSASGQFCAIFFVNSKSYIWRYTYNIPFPITTSQLQSRYFFKSSLKHPQFPLAKKTYTLVLSVSTYNDVMLFFIDHNAPCLHTVHGPPTFKFWPATFGKYFKNCRKFSFVSPTCLTACYSCFTFRYTQIWLQLRL